MQINTIKIKCKLLLAFSLVVLWSSFTLLHAQTNDLAVMHIKSKGKYNRVFTPQTNLKKLVDKGGNNAATIEFWAMHNTEGSLASDPVHWYLTNFENNTKSFSLDVNTNKVELQVANQKLNANLLLGDQLFKDTWYHFAITIDKNAQELRVYINGQEKIFINAPNFDIQDLYLVSDTKTDLFLAEYRAWSTAKTKEEIEFQKFQSFYKETQNKLTELKGTGLEIVYTTNNISSYENFGSNAFVSSSWKNLMYSFFPNDNLVEKAEFVTSYKNTAIAKISTDINHPILGLDKIIVKASDGDGVNHALLSGTNGIVISWLHAKETDEYEVLRRNIRSGTISRVIHTERNVADKKVSEELTYEDRGVLPNELYEYTIQAKKAGAPTKVGKDIGFVLPNGKVSGTIQTSSSVPTKNAKVEAVVGTNPGGALHIEQGAKPIFVKNVEGFRKTEGGASLEFWYKTPVVGDGENKILIVGNAELIVKKNTIKVTLDGNTYLEATRTSDTSWHQYAFTFGANGGQLYEDGEVMENGATKNLFRVNLLGSSYFSIANTTSLSFYLDEVRFWNVERTPEQIRQYANHIIGGKVDDLFAYYRFDFNHSHKLFNFSSTRRGQYLAESEEELKHLPAAEQPQITYATYTDEVGNYEFTTLNTGIQGVTNNDTKLEFTILPSKPRFEFLPKTKVVGVPRKLNGTEVVDVDFTDVSSLPITGVITYRVGNDLFPVLKGTSLKVDGTVIQSVEDAKVTTDNTGSYAIKAAPGKHIITPNTRPNLTNLERLNEASLRFDGTTGYAESNQVVDNEGGSFTWSGFVKPYLKKKDTDVVPTTQTILQWGDISLKLINNTTFKVFSGTEEKLSEAISTTEQNQFVFFGISYNKESGIMTLYINNRKKNTAVSTLAINDKLIVGSEKINNKFTNYSKSHLDILEYRTTALVETDITKLREGKYITPERSKLVLSYSFDQKYGTKVINLANLTHNENNYLEITEGCSFDNTVRKQYLREVEYSYKATNPKFNPKGENYELVIEEPLQNINFENITRYSFVGNIAVPCNYNVGAWTGKIVRTDIEHPKFEKIIKAENFNIDNTIFTVNDLLPGRYRVEITNTSSGKTEETPIIDLRAGNVVYDFEYRNPLKAEIVEIRNFNLEGIGNLKQANKYVGDEINSSCSDLLVLKGGQGIVMSVAVFEEYGTNKCYINNAEVSLGGDAIIVANGLKRKSNNLGRSNFITQVSGPNFVGDLSRKFLISVNHEGRVFQFDKKAIMEGTTQSNSDFTLLNPQVGFVLHDPPGDNSFSTLAKGSTFSFSSSSENGTDISIATNTGATVSTEVTSIALNISAPMGVGAAVGFGTPVAQSTSTLAGQIGGDYSHRTISGSGYSVTLEKSISTPSDPTYVGEDADVFVGVSNVLSIGTGREVKVTNCVPVVESKNETLLSKDLIPFAYTKQSLIDVVIPNLRRQIITKYDANNNIVTPPKDRDHLDLEKTVSELLKASPKDAQDKDIANYVHQVSVWEDIIKTNSDKLKKENFSKGLDFSSTTEKLTQVQSGDVDLGSGPGLNPSVLDRRITFDALTEISYSLSRSNNSDSGSTNGGGFSTGFSKDLSFKAFGIGLTTNITTSISGVFSSTTSNTNDNSRVDSFTLNDDDAGDQFDVSIRRDPQYDTPMFLTNAGRSSCPFESGTVPREGVELIVDKVVGYGTGDESILFNLTLRNTQIAKDATRKTYIVGMDGASNSLGAVVNLNESPIFEPTTSSKFVFGLDPSSPTGVQQEIKAQLRIARGTDAPSVISYENIKIQMYSECEQSGDRYRSYGVDEYNEVGVKPLSEILVTAHFTGACIEEITADAPQNDWIVNGSDKKKLDFKFRIPELKDKPDTDDFSVDLEYTIQGNNTPRILKKLDLKTLKANLDANTDQVTYSADVSGLTDGEYSFRIVPVCGDGGSDNPNNRKNPTAFVKGKIARNAPKLVLTTPDNGGIHTTGTISAKFSAPINPATVNLNSLAMRGILGGIPKPLTAVKLDNINDVISIPHNSRFNFDQEATIEMWVNPAKFPATGSVPIIHKGNNFGVLLTSNGKIEVGDGVMSSVGLQPFTWTHVAVVADKVNGNATIYFNGNPVGSGRISTVLKTNENPILIAPVVNSDAFVGSLDEIRLWRSQRTPAEIVSHMKNQLLGNEDTLEAYFVFNNNTLAKQGINGEPDEAIQDFTGNAQGTTATGIDFVTNEEAAPLDITKTVEDIQFTTTMSENNTIINFNMKIEDLEFVEGAQLTVFVKDKKLEDPLGNKVDKASWSFIVDRSKLKWSQNNISIAQNQGESTTIENIDLINQDGGVDVDYTFENLPVWFEVKSGASAAEGATNTIRARETNSDLVFEVKSFLNPGVHSANIYIKTSNKNTGVKLGVESFRVEVTVTCPEPVVSQSFKNDYPFTMDFKGNLIINNQKSLDVDDSITAFIGDIPRGYAKVTSNGIVNLTVFGNIGETRALNFKIWDASECTEFEGILENYNFLSTTSQGTNQMPVTFTVGQKVKRRIPVTRGFQELSFNLKDTKTSNSLSLSAIKGLPYNSQIFEIANPTISALVGVDGNFTGTLTEIDVKKSYLVNVTTDDVKFIEIVGLPVDLNTNLSVLGGKVVNAIPFYPNNLERTNYALRSFTSTNVSDGDRIERRGLFAEYSASEGWRGSLTHLTPGLGYIFKSTKSGAINYSGIVSATSNRLLSRNSDSNFYDANSTELEETPSYKDLDLTINVNKYINFMYINGIVNNQDLEFKANTILAFVGEELRGVSKVEFINGEYHYYIGIGSNEIEEVQFKLYDGVDLVDLENVETFSAYKTMGSLSNPYRFTLKKNSLDSGELLSLSQNVPNPMENHTEISFSIPEDALVDISIYNTIGQKIHTLIHKEVKGKTKHKIRWNGLVRGSQLEKGVYIYELRTSGQRLQRKLIMK
ncbi:LamG-like jellyroll fold domain-containing protein [Tenacibaculum sp. ZS6-P6]|uniref:LamG-like jellyroll fold domain-containing protein n=1 Tax=Tenacibaculum sp. ZS6-P6 TaxID=3447503 RepID=UPI003F97AF34